MKYFIIESKDPDYGEGWRQVFKGGYGWPTSYEVSDADEERNSYTTLANVKKALKRATKNRPSASFRIVEKDVEGTVKETVEGKKRSFTSITKKSYVPWYGGYGKKKFVEYQISNNGAPCKSLSEARETMKAYSHHGGDISIIKVTYEPVEWYRCGWEE